MGLRLRWLDSLDAPAFPAQAYEHLRQRLPQATPFNSLGWLRAAAAALEPGHTLQVLLGFDRDHLCLCLPLVRMPWRIGPLTFSVVRHLGYPLSDRIGLLIDLPERDAPQVLREIRRHLPHALLQLSEVTQGEPWLLHWGWRSSTHERRRSCSVPVHQLSAADRQEVSGDPRYKLRRARKRIAACGAQVRRVVLDADNAGDWLGRIAAVEDASWKGDDGVGIFSTPASRAWMTQALTALAGEGRLRLVVLELDGQCISYRLGLLEQGRLYDYNLAFLPHYAELGSGRVLLQAWIDWGLDDGWQWIDASRVSLENSSHQLHERMSGQVEHLRHSFYSWRVSGIGLGLALRLWRHCRPWLRSSKTSPPPQKHPSEHLPSPRRPATGATECPSRS
ncbi:MULTISPECIES: GNAT family N-acetyltransferase [unclassified Pseudomonas]|uniref:GNAT family N-acetyltransferase n=1 Tax=unclassified Pseudomonas TaxID=196821 RepID=UPI0021CA1F73|nr:MULTISPECIES: GNAT family N-acetyltransferase [unclassified Pseudomonas]MCU1734958.1 GNAT family N-acetyltransferase [Pseudomonas sp. 20P_3.2_Bac4]MCU1743433.1 GNAT family N-acetyltransferase [Pseudomonas sp. 20P_3.2_Bac5]